LVHPLKITIFADVIEIERHITKLLLANDCVIVPGFGGFIAHHIEAAYDEIDNMFYPPLRTLGFNPQLKMNDSLLALSFIEVYDISYPEALSRIENNVDEIISLIEENGYYEMCDLGVIRLGNDGHYDFEPCEAGILTPSLYGLNSYCIAVANDNVAGITDLIVSPVEGKAQTTEDTADTNSVDNSGKEMSLQVSVSMLRNVAAALIIFALFILFPAPIGENGTQGLLKSKLDTNLLLNIITKDIPTKLYNDSKIVKKMSMTQDNNENKDKDIQRNDNQQEVVQKTYYTIVLASKVSRKNAESFANKLHSNGYDKAKIYGEGRNIKVIYSEYATEKEAVSELNKLNDNIYFADGWITKIKEQP